MGQHNYKFAILVVRYKKKTMNLKVFQRTVFSLLHWSLAALSMQQLQSSSLWSLSKSFMTYARYCVLHLHITGDTYICIVYIFQALCLCVIMCCEFYVKYCMSYNHSYITHSHILITKIFLITHILVI